MNIIHKRLFTLDRPCLHKYQVIDELMETFTHKLYKDVNPLDNFRVLMKDCGVSMERLNSLNVIHVAGTKGKGSTCAFIESILRHHNFKTGFYSSPHIRCINDRVKINSTPISVDKYLRHLQFASESIRTPLPSVGRDGVKVHTLAAMCTMVSILAFLEEKVDVAILETILGGRYDDTNVATKPIVCGITQIDLDHCKFLGKDLETIAWFKAGIIKKDVPVFVQDQSAEVLDVFRTNADKFNAPLTIAPPFDKYTANEAIHLGLDGNFQKPNASLALQISNAWMETTNHTNKPSITKSKPAATTPFHLSAEHLQGLSNCVWPCRAQTITKDNITFLLEGAHTPTSCQYAAEWYKDSVRKLNPVKRILIFASKAGKDVIVNFRPFKDIQFDEIVLCIDFDQKEYKYTARIENMNVLYDSLKLENHSNVSFFKTFPEAFAYVETTCDEITDRISIFVTGSLSLCANVLKSVEDL